jgi:hypothetical protein
MRLFLLEKLDITEEDIDEFEVYEYGDVTNLYLRIGSIDIKLNRKQLEKIRWYFENT